MPELLRRRFCSSSGIELLQVVAVAAGSATTLP
jgi:hypothetical protein